MYVRVCTRFDASVFHFQFPLQMVPFRIKLVRDRAQIQANPQETNEEDQIKAQNHAPIREQSNVRFFGPINIYLIGRYVFMLKAILASQVCRALTFNKLHRYM